MNNPPSSQDQMNEFLLARITALETIVMLLWNEHPNRAAIRDAAKTIFFAEEANDLASQSGDIPVSIRATTNQSVFERVFTELLSELDCAELRVLKEHPDKS